MVDYNNEFPLEVKIPVTSTHWIVIRQSKAEPVILLIVAFRWRLKCTTVFGGWYCYFLNIHETEVTLKILLPLEWK